VAVIGWEHASEVLPTVVGPLVNARGGEETSQWRRPVDLVSMLRQVDEELSALMQEGHRHGPPAPNVTAGLTKVLLGEDPSAIIETLKGALRRGVPPVEPSKEVAYAAAMRIGRFTTANEFDDWNEAGRIVARYLALRHPAGPLIRTQCRRATTPRSTRPMNTHLLEHLAIARLDEARAKAAHAALIRSLRPVRQPLRILVGLAATCSPPPAASICAGTAVRASATCGATRSERSSRLSSISRPRPGSLTPTSSVTTRAGLPRRR